MSKDLRTWVSPNIETLKPYVPGKPIQETERELGITGVVKLASNENALGPSPLALAAVSQALASLHLYPDGASFYLNHKLAQVLGVKTEEVFVGSGSNEIIELLIRTFTVPDDEALLCQGSFLMYKVSLQAHGRPFREVPMREGFRYDLEAMAGALGPKTRLVFLANPDNPTGTAFSRTELEAFLAKVPPTCLVVLDEAYFEFVAWDEYPNGLDYFRKMPNLVVLRTFSKIYGLAGLRVGYGIMSEELTRYLHRTRMPFNVTSLAQAGGVAALDDAGHVQKTRTLTHAGLRMLEAGLTALGANVPHSHANFVFADFGRPAHPIYEALLRRGLITRPIPAYGFPNALRISVGLEAQNARLLQTLSEILK
jgi:histidinol-phosphate aminotransferase